MLLLRQYANGLVSRHFQPGEGPTSRGFIRYCEIFAKLRFKLYLVVLLLVRAAETECLHLMGVKVQLHAEVAEDDSPL